MSAIEALDRIMTDTSILSNHQGSSTGRRKKRTLRIAASSDESDQEENGTDILAAMTKEYELEKVADEQSSSCSLSNTAYIEIRADSRKRRTLHIADSSDESDQEENALDSHTSVTKELDLEEVADNQSSSSCNSSNTARVESSDSRKKRALHIADSSDESDREEDETDFHPSMTKQLDAAEVLDDQSSSPCSSSNIARTDGRDQTDKDEQSSSPCSSTNIALTPSRVSDQSDNESEKETDSSSDSSSSDDDDAPPIRIFRNKNAAAMNSRGYDSGNDLNENDSSDNEENNDVASDVTVAQPRRKPKRHVMPSALEIKSETQRLIRESRVNLPYHIPEAKKLSQFMKRPNVFQEKKGPFDKSNSTKEEKSQTYHNDEKQDSGVEIPDLNGDDRDEQEMGQSPLPGESVPDRKTQLLALSGIEVPSLTANDSGLSTPNPTPKFISFDDNEQKENSEISNFMERFLKHSRLEPTSSKKKVQFNIIKKEERADGTGTELVPDVISVSPKEDDEAKKIVGNYKTLREKLAAKMKQRRSVERKKREELYKLDNEEVGENDDDNDEAEEWTDEESSEEEEEEESDDAKNHIIDDDDDDESLAPTQVAPPEISLSNTSSTSRISQHTFKSESLFSHLNREESISLFEDTVKKSNQSKEEDTLQDQSFDPLYTSTIPPNKPKNTSDVSLKRLTSDEDSYFCSDRSINHLSNQSPTRQDFESQFFDSDGFIKEPKAEKSLISLLPPGGEDDNANDCNMSQLLELCSGKFQVSNISPQPSDVEASSDVNGAFVDESFGFQVEADTAKQDTVNGFSDDEEDAEEADDGITIVRKKKVVTEKLAKDFFEDEAELSGDDVGSDEDEDIGENKYEEEIIEEQLPKEEVLHQQVNKVHLKQLLDEDQRDIDLLQEAFVTEAVDVRRNRKFRWKNIDENLTPDLFHSDDDEENCGDDVEDVVGSEESQWRMLRLKREEYFNSKTGDGHTEDVDVDPEEDSQLLRIGRSALKRSRIFSEINEDSKTNQGSKGQSLSRSNSLTAPKLPSRNSFLARNPELLSKFANFKEATVLKGAVNSDRMVFKALSPNKKSVKVKRPAMNKPSLVKRPRLDEDSNSIFNLFEM